jgi:hypothetical protein
MFLLLLIPSTHRFLLIIDLFVVVIKRHVSAFSNKNILLLLLLLYNTENTTHAGCITILNNVILIANKELKKVMAKDY